MTRAGLAGGGRLASAVALVLTLCWSVLLGISHQGGDIRLLDRFEAVLTDLRFLVRGVRAAPEIATIVTIDDEVVARDGRYPVSRATLAAIVDAIAAEHPRAIVVDVLLLDAGPPADDAALAAALARAPCVIAIAAVFPTARQRVDGGEEGPLSRMPFAERFLDPQPVFASAAATGVVNVATDRTGTPRMVPLVFRSADRIEASLPLRAAALAAGAEAVFLDGAVEIGGRRIALDVAGQLPLGYFGPARSIRTISGAAALGAGLPRNAIAGRIVVLGGTVTGGGDVFPTPFDPVLPGVEVLATAIVHLSGGEGLVRDRRVRTADAAVAAALSLAMVGLLAWRRSAAGFAAIVALGIAWLTANLAAFSAGLWMSAALPLAAAGPPVFLFGAAQLWLGRRRAQRLAAQRDLLRRFQPPALRSRLADDPEFLAQPVRQHAAIVFIDLSGFTGLSEAIGPAPVRDLLAAFHDLLSVASAENGGIVTSFMGDGAMIVFGLPEPAGDDAARAAGCAAGLARRTRAWLATLPDARAAAIGFKIGAHFGAIVASRLGGGGHEHITATGDTVNVAARLMEVAAARNADIAVSEDLLRAAGPGNALAASGTLGARFASHIRGRSGALPVRLWRADHDADA